MNCLGLTAFCSSSVETSCRTYSPGNDGRGGLASVLAIRFPPSGSRYHGTSEPRSALDGSLGGGGASSPLLEGHPEGDVQPEHQDVDGGGDDVAQGLVGHRDPAAPADRRGGLAELHAFAGDGEQQL